MKRITSLFTLIVLGFLNFAQAHETLQSVTDNGHSTTNRLWLQDGAILENDNLWLNGGSMGYSDPIRIYPNLDNSGIALQDAAIRFDQPNDVFDAGGSSLVFHYPHSGIPYFRRFGTDFTILKIWSPRNVDHAYESTLALVNGDGEDLSINQPINQVLQLPYPYTKVVAK